MPGGIPIPYCMGPAISRSPPVGRIDAGSLPGCGDAYVSHCSAKPGEARPVSSLYEVQHVDGYGEEEGSGF